MTHSTTEPSATKAMCGWRSMKPSAWCGLIAHSTAGWSAMCGRPSAISAKNHTAVTGPKKRPMPPVPKRCTTNSAVSTTSVIGTT